MEQSTILILKENYNEYLQHVSGILRDAFQRSE